MSGFGGAGAFSDGKYNITNDFGGTLYEYIGKKQALDLMRYVDTINMRYGGEGTKLYSTAGSRFKTECIRHDLYLLDASVRHLGTDINYVVLENPLRPIYTRCKLAITTAQPTSSNIKEMIAASSIRFRPVREAPLRWPERSCWACWISVS